MSDAKTPEPMPVRKLDGSQREVTKLVLFDLLERDRMGAEKYGGSLVTNDGRATKWDAYQEVLDLAQYMRKDIEEENEIKSRVNVLLDFIGATPRLPMPETIEREWKWLCRWTGRL